MNPHPSDQREMLLDFIAFPPETVTLEPSDINQALQLSLQSENETQQWQIYLNTLSLLGFEQWLTDQMPEIQINHENCSLYSLSQAQIIESVCNLTINHFKLCIITVGSLSDQVISLSRIALEIPEFTAHFYVVVEVQEELEQVQVKGFIRYDQLIEQCQSSQLQPEADWSYPLPLAWFDSNLHYLLLHLRCLEPSAIALPAHSSALLLRVSAKLEQLLPELRSLPGKLSDVLTWEQALVLFTHPELFQGLNLASEPTVTSNALLNVGVWLRDQLDELAQELSWVLLPAFSDNRLRLNPAPAMRSPIEELDDILIQLERTGADISTQARGAYQNLQLGDTALRLYVVTWPLLSTENVPEWKLLLILGAPSGNSLPHGTTLQVSDNTSVLVECRRDQNTDAPYLYARVAGTWEETFSITISLLDGTAIILPPFAFRP